MVDASAEMPRLLGRLGHHRSDAPLRIANYELLNRDKELIAAAVKAGKLTATRDVAAAVRDTEISLISVATPALEQSLDFANALLFPATVR